jgi:hypothetical protein
MLVLKMYLIFLPYLKSIAEVIRIHGENYKGKTKRIVAGAAVLFCGGQQTVIHDK